MGGLSRSSLFCACLDWMFLIHGKNFALVLGEITPFVGQTFTNSTIWVTLVTYAISHSGPS